MTGLVPVIHAAPFPAVLKRSGGLTTSPIALAFGWNDRDKPGHGGSAVVILAHMSLTPTREDAGRGEQVPIFNDAADY